MAGSKRSKPSQNKGKSKAERSDAINGKPGRFNSNLEFSQSSNNNLGGSLTTLTKKEIVPLLYKKLTDSYNKVKDSLLESGCTAADVERAFLSNGYIHGSSDPVVNIAMNSVAFLKNEVKPAGGGFKTLDELYGTMLEVLMDYASQSLPNIPNTDAMWQLYVSDWGSVPSIPSFLQRGDQNRSDSLVHDDSRESALSENKDLSLNKVRILERISQTPELISLLEKNVPMIADSIRLEIGSLEESTKSFDSVRHDFPASSTRCSREECLTELLECSSADPECVSLVKTIRDVHDMVEERKKWAYQKVCDAAKRLSKDTLEVKLLRIEKDKWDEEGALANLRVQKLMEVEQALQDVMLDAKSTAAVARDLETATARILADIEASKLTASESEEDLKRVLKRERKCLKKLTEFGKQRSRLQAQCDTENHRLLQLQKELLQAEKEVEEAEPKLRHEIKAKEQMLARLAEDTRMVAVQIANCREHLSKLRQKLEMDSQLARDECLRLEDELSRLQLSHQMANVSMGDDSFLYDCPEAISFTASASASCESFQEIIKERKCRICSQNEVSVVFLPCAHQVVCSKCHEDNGKFSGGRCPYCQVKIGQCIMVFGVVTEQPQVSKTKSSNLDDIRCT